MATATDKLIQDGLWRDISEADVLSGLHILITDYDGYIKEAWASTHTQQIHDGASKWMTPDSSYSDPSVYMPLDTPRRLANALKVAVDSLREQIEIWAGSEVGNPVYAQEAYAIRLCKQMYNEASGALAEIERIANGGRGRWIS